MVESVTENKKRRKQSEVPIPIGCTFEFNDEEAMNYLYSINYL